MPQQSLVQTWLAAIGLAPEILQTFEAAGIVNPKDLAELQICHYPALGVQQPGDRKKLFYLVQRVKLAVPQEEEEDHGENNGGDLNDIIDLSSASFSNLTSSVAKTGNNNSSANGNGAVGAVGAVTKQSKSSRWQTAREDPSQNAKNSSNQNSDRDIKKSRSTLSASSRRRVKSNSNTNKPKSAEESRRMSHNRTNRHNRKSVVQNNEDEDGYTSNFDTDDDDGIDAALQEQYNPMLSPSSSVDLLSENDNLNGRESDNDDDSSQEEIPSPPRRHHIRRTSSDFESSDNDPDDSFGISIGGSNSSKNQSPFRNKREEEFLTRRNARLAKISSPKKKIKNVPKTATSSLSGSTTTTATSSTAARDIGQKRISNRSKSRSSTNNDEKGNMSDRSDPSASNRSKSTTLSNNSKSSLNKSYTNSTSTASRRPRSANVNSSLQRDKSTDETNNKSQRPTSTSNNSSTTTTSTRRKVLEGKRLNISTSSKTAATTNTSTITVSTRRTSQRLQEKQARERLNLRKSTTNATNSDQDDQETCTTQLSPSINTSKIRSRKSVSSSNDENDLDSILDDTISPVSPESDGGGSDSSSNSRGRNRQTSKVSTLGQSKRLATIPSGRIASLRDLGDMEDDEIFSDEFANKRKQNQTTTVKKSGTEKDAANGIRAKSAPKSRESIAQMNISRSMTNFDVDLNVVTEINENVDTTLNGQQRKKTMNKTSASSTGMVFVHGKRKKESWTTKVDSLREQNDQLYQDQFKVGQLDTESDEEMRIRVVVRKRPMSRKEAAHADDADVIHPLQYNDYGRILVYQPKTRVDLTREVETIPFAFDNVFPEQSDNCQIYDETIRSLIPGAFEGRWASVFAYGQTGSGKTFTMMGSTLTGIKARNRNVKHEKNYGLYLLAARDLFAFARRREYSHFTIRASLFEIYGGKLFDLLNDRAPVKCLENHQGRVCFPGLSEHMISSAEDLMTLIEKGASNRSTGSTSANRDSSRSHAVLQLHLRKPNGPKPDEEHGRLTFIDLAGSERGADTDQASRTTRLEGAEINTSLLALKEVIRALATGDAMTHIPFRGSKLTQVLKESFVGKNSRTVMVACVAPNMTNCEHTLNTLRYADRVKERNSETGKLSASVEAASKITKKQITSAYRPISAPPAGTDLLRNQSKASLAKVEDENFHSGDDRWLSDLDNDDDHDDHEDDNDDDDLLKVSMDELNEVLKTPVQEAKSFTFEDEEHDSLLNHDVQQVHGSPRAKSKKEAVSPLINTHRSIMSEMLSMVKQEMTLVNCTDEDRALIDDYLQELEQIQDKQLAMISTLRESLVKYYGDRPSSEDLDDSFEALLSS